MKIRILGIITALVLAGCFGKDKNQNTTGSLLVKFNHLYKGQALQVLEDNSLIYSTAKGNAFNIKNIKYFISKLTLTKADGSIYDVNMYKLINPNESNLSYQEFNLTGIPEGTYTKISFQFGIDTARNTFPFGLPNNSENNSMEWPFPLGGGYHFLILEGVYRNNSNDTVGYAIHLGKTPNQIYNEYPLNLVVSDNSNTTNIQVNIDQWFDGINEINLNDGFGYIMEDDQKQLLFKQNGASVFTKN